MKIIIAIVAAAGSVASADIVINEVLGSTAGPDNEFVELYNGGASAMSIDGWTIELYDSDIDAGGSGFGGADGFGVLNLTGSIAAGGHWLAANALAEAAYGVTADLQFGSNGIENSSYTILLKDDLGTIIDSVFVTDGGMGDAANDAGTLITPGATIGPDGSFLPAGFYRIGDGSANLGILEFSQPSPSATPGAANIPAPAGLALIGLGGLAAARRRR